MIHKGTLYYFLAENYLLIGAADLAFTYLYNAVESDIALHQSMPSYNYGTSPAYLTATMMADKNNHMYPLIKQIRNKLEEYINEFNKGYDSFKSQDFDSKFLKFEAQRHCVLFCF